MSKTTNKTVNILLEHDTKEILEQEAKEQNRSLRGHIKFILEQYTKDGLYSTQLQNSTNNTHNSNTSKLTTLKDNIPNNISKF